MDSNNDNADKNNSSSSDDPLDIIPTKDNQPSINSSNDISNNPQTVFEPDTKNFTPSNSENLDSNKQPEDRLNTSHVESNNVNPQQPIVGDGGVVTSTNNSLNLQPKKWGFKKFGIVPIIAVVALLLFSAGAAAYIGVIRPNNPEYIWNSAISNTGKGLDKISELQAKQKDTKGMKYKGSLGGSIQKVAFDGNLEGQSYGANSKFKADLGSTGVRVNLDLVTTKKENAKNPDVYIKVSGLEGVSALLGVADSEFKPIVDSINSQWYLIDHSLFDQMAASSGSDFKLPSISPEQSSQLTSTVVNVSQDYLFTSDASKSVFVKTQNVGSESKDGRNVYHYKVKINKENFKAYLNELNNQIKKLNIDGLNNNDKMFKQLTDSVDKIKDSDNEADVWVDKQTMLVRTIRINDKEKKDSYLELSLNYNGGDDIPLELKYVANENGSNIAFTAGINMNIKTAKSTASLNYVDNMDNKFSAKLDIEPSNGNVEIKIPENAKSILELSKLLSAQDTFKQIQPVTKTLGVFDNREL